MFNYVTDVSNIARRIVQSYTGGFNVAIDATLGNGHDTDFLSEIFTKVYAFDIQELSINNYKHMCNNNVILIHDSHENFKRYINEEVDCIMYNLGFLPGGDRNITTKVDITLKSIELGLNLLKIGGIMTVGIYPGHDEGKREKNELLKYLSRLPKEQYGVIIHTFHNRASEAPLLALIEKSK